MSYALPKQSPFSYNVGMCFHTNMCNWYVSDSVKYSRENQIQYSQDRLEKVVETFKLVRIYGFLTAGWLSTGTLDPCAQAFVNVLKNNSNVEGVISTTDDTKSWFQTASNVDSWVAKLKSEMGNAISQIKCIEICNEINAHGFTPADLNTIFTNFKNNADFMALKIPLTVSFSNLPCQAGDANSDGLVKAVMQNWDSSWNENCPFVFINPYPDAPGIDSPAGVFEWQGKVQAYYENMYPNIQIFIAETGAEGCATNAESEPVIDGIFQQLDSQFKTNNMTVPTFLFEALDEQRKLGQPIQSNMGVYMDTAAADGKNISIKPNITVPQWVSEKMTANTVA